MWIVTSVLGREAEPLREETDECFRRGGRDVVEGMVSDMLVRGSVVRRVPVNRCVGSSRFVVEPVLSRVAQCVKTDVVHMLKAFGE